MALFPYYAPQQLQSYVEEPSSLTAFGNPLQQLQLQNRRNLSNTMQSLQPFTPLLSTDLVESETDFHVHVDLPGVSQGDLDITCADGNLIIKAERREIKETDSDFVSKISLHSNRNVTAVVKT